MTRRLTWRRMILPRPGGVVVGWCVCFERPFLRFSGNKANTKRQNIFSFTQADTSYIYIYAYPYLIWYSTILSRKWVIHGNSYGDPPKILLPQLRGPGKPPWRLPAVVAPGLTDQIGISHYRKLETATGEAASFGWQGFYAKKRFVLGPQVL